MNKSTVEMDAQESARQLLASYWGNRGFPVDPAWIAGQLGISIVEAELPQKVKGSLIKDQGKQAIIVLNQVNNHQRKRVICAHQLGHYTDRRLHGGDFYKYVAVHQQRHTDGNEVQDEIFADLFSVALLMPEQEIMRLVEQDLSPYQMAQYFGVSENMLRRRLDMLELHVEREEILCPL